MVGRLASLSPIPRMVSAVFDVYGVRDVLHHAAGAAQATALGRRWRRASARPRGPGRLIHARA
jgi:hypothetical protein